jgi:tRNA(fMet)-specific endonuclease VapC
VTPQPYLLDTSILVRFVRGDAVWARIQSRYQLLATDPRPMISVVTAGELRSLAYQRHWSAAKRSQMEFGLGYFKVVTIHDPAIIEAYAVIDSHFTLKGHPFGKNDLWIAATAQVMGARLLTTDRDFDAMDPLFLSRDWIDPSPPP